MKHLSASFPKLLAVAACALALASCNRSEYAMLPKSASYHGVSRVATPVPPEKAPAAALAPAATLPAAAAVTAPAAPAPVAAVPTAPPAKPTAGAPAPSAAPETAAVTPPATPRKLNLVQRLALAKVTRKLDKKLTQASRGQHQNAASTTRLDESLRTALIVLLVGVIVAAFAGVAGIFGIIGTIIIIIGLVLLLLYLLDKA